MTQVKFVGDPADPKPDIPEQFEALGLTFIKGKADTADLPANRRNAVEVKLAGNSHFEVKGDEPKPHDAK